MAQGVSGLMSVTGEPGGAPVKVGVPISDLGAGLFAVMGILGAVIAKQRTGEGQFVDTSLVDAGVALSVWEATQFFSGRGVPEALGSAHRMNAPYQAIRCADGYITLGAANDRIFGRLCDVLGHPEWRADPDFRDDAHRLEHRARLIAGIEALTVSKPRDHWLRVFEAKDIPCGPINDYAEVMRDAHVRARGLVVDTDHPTLGRIETLGSAVKLSKTPLTPGRPAPMLGEHTDEVLLEVGFEAREVEGFRKDGVVA